MIGEYWLVHEIAKERQSDLLNEADNARKGLSTRRTGRFSAIAKTFLLTLKSIF
jgi:hypothetical protein